jgi:hypothetical protein
MANRARETRGRPFEPGNTFGRGRPRGSRNKKSFLAQELLESHSEALVRKALMQAFQGDSAVLRTLLGCVLQRRDLPVKTGPLPMASAAELSQTSEAVLKRLATGQISLPEAQGIFELIEIRRRVIETRDLEKRVCAIEEPRAEKDPP